MTHRTDFINSGFQSVVPSDTVPVNFHGLIVGGAGNVSVVDSLGATTVIAAIAGQTIPGRIVLVTATGTTATRMVGWRFWRPPIRSSATAFHCMAAGAGMVGEHHRMAGRVAQVCREAQARQIGAGELGGGAAVGGVGGLGADAGNPQPVQPARLIAVELRVRPRQHLLRAQGVEPARQLMQRLAPRLHRVGRLGA